MKAEKIISTTGLNNCGGRCVIKVHLEDGKIKRLTTESCSEANGEIPLRACICGINYHKTFLGEDRLRYPMRRIGKRGEGKFERISWEEAISIIAKEWIRIRDTYGPGSRYVNYAWGVSGVLHPPTLAMRLLALDGGYLNYYNSYSTGCINTVTQMMYGTRNTGNDPKHWLESELIILWGHNPAETRFDSVTMHYLKEASRNGTKIIVIDPRYTDTISQLHAQWIPIRPTTDAALADGMAYVIYTKGLQDQDFLDRCCIGFDREHMPEGVDSSENYLDYLLGKKDGIPKTPEWASRITGISEHVITEIAISYATAKPAALIQGYGAQRHACGEQSVRGGILLACMTGNVGIAGGWASGSAGFSRHQEPSFPVPQNPYTKTIPCYAWTDAVDHGTQMPEKLDCNIKMILNLAGNCLINQHGDINRTAEILRDTSKCEFIVCSDLFMTSSARFADILLPGTSMFESENITMPWKYGDFLGFTNKVIEPLYESRFEYDWLAEVADQIGLKEEFTLGRTSGEWLEYLYQELQKTETELPPFSEFKETGIFHYQNNPDFITFEKERNNPEKYPFPTPSGKIELFSEDIYIRKEEIDLPAIPGYVAVEEGAEDWKMRQKYPLQLIGWHTKRRSHSIHDNNTDLAKTEPQRLWMNPTDAIYRKIQDGQMVLIYNDRGKIKVPVKLTDKIIPGVTALSEGAWYHPDENGTDLAGSLNVLTSLKLTPYSKGNPQHTNLVEVTPVLN